jgi:hypothetical protein
MKNLFLIYQKGGNGVTMSSIRVFDNLDEAGKHYIKSGVRYGNYFCLINDDGTRCIIKGKKLIDLFNTSKILKK